ncbi:hypothetical protein [Arthrobacter sp. NPDC056493]|uniref:hypothetical protein n=1 Tax=Arthrobacter sp. NPDC056493 TaxID=3345839 RepID=UPI003670EBB9
METKRYDYAPRDDGSPYRWDEPRIVEGFDLAPFDLASTLEIRNLRHILDKLIKHPGSLSSADVESVQIANELCALRHYEAIVHIENGVATVPLHVQRAIQSVVGSGQSE